MGHRTRRIQTLGAMALSGALAFGLVHLRAQDTVAGTNNAKVTLSATVDQPTAATSSTNPPATDQASVTNKSEFYSKEGGYVIPLKVSADSTAQQYGNDFEQQKILDLITTNSAGGNWTLIITHLNRFEHPDSGFESYALLQGDTPAYVNVVWMPKGDVELTEDLKSKGDPIVTAQGLQCLDNPPVKLKVDGNDAVLIRYRNSSPERDVLMGLDKGDRRYIVTMTAKNKDEPDNEAFSRIIKELKFR